MLTEFFDGEPIESFGAFLLIPLTAAYPLRSATGNFGVAGNVNQGLSAAIARAGQNAIRSQSADANLRRGNLDKETPKVRMLPPLRYGVRTLRT